MMKTTTADPKFSKLREFGSKNQTGKATYKNRMQHFITHRHISEQQHFSPKNL